MYDKREKETINDDDYDKLRSIFTVADNNIIYFLTYSLGELNCCRRMCVCVCVCCGLLEAEGTGGPTWRRRYWCYRGQVKNTGGSKQTRARVHAHTHTHTLCQDIRQSVRRESEIITHT